MIDDFAIIIGAMKSGTTTLYNVLAQHPELARCEEKEPNFFADDANFARGLEWYESRWDLDSARHKYALEASTHYTKRPVFPNAARRMARCDRNFKFIYILREPVARIESHLTFGLWSGWLEERRPIREHQHAIDVTRYAYQLAPYLEHFDRRDMLLVDFADLRDDAVAVAREVVSFLGVSTDAELDPAVRKNASVNNVREPGFWRALASIEPLERFVVNYVPRSLRTGLRRLVGKQVDRVRLSEQERRFVYEQLADDIDELGSKYGFEPRGWGPDR